MRHVVCWPWLAARCPSGWFVTPCLCSAGRRKYDKSLMGWDWGWREVIQPLLSQGKHTWLWENEFNLLPVKVRAGLWKTRANLKHHPEIPPFFPDSAWFLISLPGLPEQSKGTGNEACSQLTTHFPSSSGTGFLTFSPEPVSRNFSNMSHSRGLQFLMNCPSVGTPQGLKSCQHIRSSEGSFLHGPISPARSLLPCGLPMGSQPSLDIHLFWCGVFHGWQGNLYSRTCTSFGNDLGVFWGQSLTCYHSPFTLAVVVPAVFPYLRSVIPEILPELLMGSTFISSRSGLESPRISSIWHGGSFWYLLTETIKALQCKPNTKYLLKCHLFEIWLSLSLAKNWNSHCLLSADVLSLKWDT